jgi:hypothetical protein
MREIHPLLRNVESYNNMCLTSGGMTPELAELNIELSRKVITEMYEYFGDPQYMMVAPVCRFVKPRTDDLEVICAKSVTLNAVFNLEVAQDYANVLFKETKNLIVKTVAEEIITELEHRFIDDGIVVPYMFDRDKVLCPYMPVVGIKEIDPKTLEPTIRFKTRYGII